MSGKNWDLTKLSFELTNSISQNINAIMNYNTHRTNSRHNIWSVNSNGLFSTSSCYKLIDQYDPYDKDYTWLWNLHYPNKIKIFIWKCYHNRIPTRSYLAHIGININPKCPTCKLHDEIFITSFGLVTLLSTYGLTLEYTSIPP